MSKRLITADQARPAKAQHTEPCSDCPFARTSLKGWLGRRTVMDWIDAVHGEALIDCHVVSNQQCAGAAIYRANVCKVTRRRNTLELPPNTEKVFGSPVEFMAHHKKIRL